MSYLLVLQQSQSGTQACDLARKSRAGLAHASDGAPSNPVLLLVFFWLIFLVAIQRGVGFDLLEDLVVAPVLGGV